MKFSNIIPVTWILQISTSDSFTVVDHRSKHCDQILRAASEEDNSAPFDKFKVEEALNKHFAYRTRIPRRPAQAESQLNPPPHRTNLEAEISQQIKPTLVQGGSLRTCSFHELVERVSIFLTTEGRPLNANVELWQGPDNAPEKISVYIEDGSIRHFYATIETPGSSNTIAIRNIGQIEFPLTAWLDIELEDGISDGNFGGVLLTNVYRTIQGGAIYTTPLDPSVNSVRVMLKSDGRPLNAHIELLQGPNNNKQVLEIYSEDGHERPFCAIIDTPGRGNVVRIVNTSTVEFPLSASIISVYNDKVVRDDNSIVPNDILRS